MIYFQFLKYKNKNVIILPEKVKGVMILISFWTDVFEAVELDINNSFSEKSAEEKNVTDAKKMERKWKINLDDEM